MSQVSSQTSSVSSCDDYIIVLPDCFDTSRPLDKSTYSCATPLPDGEDDAVNCVQTDDALESEEEEDEEASPSVVGREGPRGGGQEGTEDTWPPTGAPTSSSSSGSVNQMLCASQTLDTVTLTPEVVQPPGAPLPTESLASPPALYSPRSGSQHGEKKR